MKKHLVYVAHSKPDEQYAKGICRRLDKKRMKTYLWARDKKGHVNGEQESKIAESDFILFIITPDWKLHDGLMKELDWARKHDRSPIFVALTRDFSKLPPLASDCEVLRIDLSDPYSIIGEVKKLISVLSCAKVQEMPEKKEIPVRGATQ